MRIDPNDIADSGFVSEAELAAIGSAGFRTESLVDVVSGTISVAASVTLINYDDPIQSGDLVLISGNAAAGLYTVDTTPTLNTFTVVEAIVDAVGGTGEFRHPPGAKRVGLDLSGLNRMTIANVQEALAELDGAQPNAHAASHAENDTDEIFAEDLGANDGGSTTLLMRTTGTGGWVLDDFTGFFFEALPLEYDHADSLPVSSTTSATYQNKVTLVVTLDGGDYLVLYNALVGGTQNGTVMAAEAVFDGIQFGEQVLKSSANNAQVSFAGHESFVGIGGGAPHTIELNWKRFSGGGQAEIQQAHISIWRVV